jgi:hypothetical protein
VSAFALVATLSMAVPASAAAATYYVAPISSNCSSTAGSGTLSDPWQNLFSALSRKVFNSGDIIILRGGTYRNSYTGFNAGCNMSNDSNGINTILPLNMTGSAGNPIIIQNYPGETVILDGTDADLINATWTACGTSSFQLNNAMNVGSAKTGQVWIAPSGASDSGTRLAYDPNTGGCSGMSPGTFRFNSSGNGLYVRLPTGSSANLADLHLSCESGECANYPINDGPMGGTSR